MNKDVIKQLILLHQSNIPYLLSEREEHLPLHVEQIVTIPGVRRSGKSSKMKLLINALVKSGVSPQNILWMGFDDERLADMSICRGKTSTRYWRHTVSSIPRPR